ncbi:MAG: phosphoenolpyruvate--protein phosphotransferase [Ornithinimicrobium sp.]
MIGIVVVSHSYALAQAAVELASEMVQSDQRPTIAVAAGLDESTFGTDASAIAEAIGEADAADGVLVLLDLGSAILSAEMALELIDPDLAQRVKLSSAALVEGLVAAVVTASGGADLGTVQAEAEAGLQGKREHLDDTAQDPSDARPETVTALAPDAESRELMVDIPHGLHARPAARLVACVHRFPGTRVRLRNLNGSDRDVDAGSLSAVASLGVRQGHRVQVWAEGEHAGAALAALTTLADARFGDGAEPVPRGGTERMSDGGRSLRAETVPKGSAAMGSGLEAAIGVVVRAAGAVDAADYRSSGDPDGERDRLRSAVQAATAELREVAATTRERVGPGEAEVFDAHVALLQDAAMTEPAYADIAEGMPAARAWKRVGDAVASTWAELPDEYQRERAQDARSVTDRVLRHLVLGGEPPSSEQADNGQHILVVSELDPATAAQVDAQQTVGILSTGGGATGHGVLIASARGIPVLTGIPRAADLSDGTLVAFDVRNRTVLLDPSESEQQDFEALLGQRATQQDEDRDAASAPGQTRDGSLVTVQANVTSAPEAEQAVGLGAEGSGLVRTEVMFGGWSSAPTVDEQVAELTAVAVALGGRPMTVRTWDIGADKPLAFWAPSAEQNPFLGVRGVRAFIEDPGLLRDQLEAICRVALVHPVRVMFPMVATVGEVQWAWEQLAHAGSRLAAGVPESLEVGIMVEVPSAALRAEAMSVLLDFVSIGTNDLTQYTMAAERGNAGVEHLFDPLDPAVLGLVARVCADVAEGVSVGVCGGAASDPASAALLVGLGVDDLSATPVAVPRVKAVLRRHTSAQLQDLAQRALHCDSAEEVREVLEGLD